MGACHLIKISGISGSAVNGTRFVGSSHWKIPRKSAKSKKVVPFSRLEFPNGMSCSVYVSRSLYQFQVGHRHVPGFTTKWNNFLPIGNSTFARKAPYVYTTLDRASMIHTEERLWRRDFYDGAKRSIK